MGCGCKTSSEVNVRRNKSKSKSGYRKKGSKNCIGCGIKTTISCKFCKVGLCAKCIKDRKKCDCPKFRR